VITLDKPDNPKKACRCRRIQGTRALRLYLLQFLFRLGLVASVTFMYVYDRALLLEVVQTFSWRHFTVVHLAWLVFMTLMLLHIIPIRAISMARRKAHKETYRERSGFEQLALLEQTQRLNLGAWRVMLVWLCFNALFGLAYLFGLIGEGELLLLTMFYFVCDHICILFFCPFQTFLMKNKCCVNCRIYDWGHFMMFTPMLFIRNFYSWSLFFMSLLVLINWELGYAKHPERYWEGSNETLQCRNCKERTCQIKRALAGQEPPPPLRKAKERSI
jgi:hypothetical protein